MPRQSAEPVRWKAASASVRGASHVRSGRPNQDAAEYFTGADAATPVTVLAVSDGHGGARHFRSDIGSALAVRTAIALARALETPPGEPPTGDAAAGLPRRIVEAWLAGVRAHFETNPFTADELAALDGEAGADSRESVARNPALAYGATLLLVVAAEDFLMCLQLGDGDILAVDTGGATTRPLAADVRLVGNQTTSLCQPEAWNDFRGRLFTGANGLPALVLASTDGYANSFRSEADFLLIGRDYLAMARERGLDGIARELPEILAEASRSGSGDDITLGILQGAIGAAAPPPAAIASRRTEAQQPEAAAHEEIASQYRRARRSVRLLSAALTLSALALAAVLSRHYWEPWLAPSHRPAPFAGSKPLPSGVGKLPKLEPGNPDSYGHWVLRLDTGADAPLIPGHKLTRRQLGAKASDGDPQEPVAEVSGTADRIGLKNVSKDIWSVKQAGHGSPLLPGDTVVLTEDTRIVFSKTASGAAMRTHPIPRGAENI